MCVYLCIYLFYNQAITGQRKLFLWEKSATRHCDAVKKTSTLWLTPAGSGVELNIWAGDVFGLREEGRVARGTCTGQPSPESPCGCQLSLPSTTKDHFARCILMVIFWTVFPISERPPCIWFLTLRLTSQPFIPLRVCHQLWQNATPCH